MDLNSPTEFSTIDRENMLAHIDGLPDQLAQAWKLGDSLPLPVKLPFDRVVVAGMGGSAIGADLLRAYCEDELSIPFIVHRNYGLPAFARGGNTLVIASSHSGNTEEVLSAYTAAMENGCQVMALTTGGKLEQMALNAGNLVWKFTHTGQPRTAVGYSFGLLHAILTRLGLIRLSVDEKANLIARLKSYQEKLNAQVPVIQNPAKRQAGNLIGRHVTFYGSGFLAPVAMRWKTQLNEVAKAFASFEVLPEADHNTLAGICNPADFNYREYAVFLDATCNDARNRLRSEKTKDILMLEGIATDTIQARGDDRLEQLWSMILFGDYMAYYLALAYDTDPTPIPPIVALKEAMRD